MNIPHLGVGCFEKQIVSFSLDDNCGTIQETYPDHETELASTFLR
jgi:hypothetical protein